jgi:hypothetical protein
LRVFLINGADPPVELQNVLALRPYEGTINTGPNGVQFVEASSKLRLLADKTESEIGVIQKAKPVPYAFPLEPGALGPYFPPHAEFVWEFESPFFPGQKLRIQKKGDPDFDGNGPRVQLKAEARVASTSGRDVVQVRVYMWAVEWDDGHPQDDFTFCEGWSEWQTVYTADAPIKILGIASDASSEADYVDSNHSVDVLRLPDGELVREFECVGDTGDDDAGIRTSVTARFNTMRLTLLNPGTSTDVQAINTSVLGIFHGTAKIFSTLDEGVSAVIAEPADAPADSPSSRASWTIEP